MGDIAALQSEAGPWWRWYPSPLIVVMVVARWLRGLYGGKSEPPWEGRGTGMLAHGDWVAERVLECSGVMKIPNKELK